MDRFDDVEERARRLRADHAAGRITDDAVERALAALAFEHEGRWWTVGGTSGDWYVHDGTRWVRARRPAAAARDRVEASDRSGSLADVEGSRGATAAVKESASSAGDWAVLAMLAGLTALFALQRGKAGFTGPMSLVLGALTLTWLVLLVRGRRDRT